MTAPVFFAEPERLRDATPGEVVLLDGAEGRHATAVRRLAVGERLELADGAGLVCRAEVVAVRSGALEARVLDRLVLPAPQPRLTVVQALAKGDRDERAVEAMTEVGVDAVVPWQASRCIVRWDADRARKGIARWRSTAREAAKQARRAWIPDVAEPEPTPGVVERLRVAAAGGLAVVLHESASVPLSALEVPSAGDVVVVVGPEGGITDEELAAFAAAGAQVCRLGPTVLRTSTAGTVATALLLARTPRWA